MTLDRKKLLDRAARDGEERILLAHVLDKWEQCDSRGIPGHTDFLSPAEQRSALDLLHAAAIHGGYALIGGYETAERRTLCFLPEWQEEPDTESLLSALRISFREEDRLTHRDLLGSLMALGVKRSKVGDILVSPDAADVIVSAETAEYLQTQWSGAGRVRFRPETIPLDRLRVPPQRVRELRDTVAGLRLDAVASTGFSVSRAKAAELIASGRVQLNYRETLKPDAQVAQGDVVSARGLGKFELSEVGGLSKKGRTSILIRRYL